MKKILCFIGFHDDDWWKANVINMFGDMWLPCKRCNYGRHITLDLWSSWHYSQILKSL